MANNMIGEFKLPRAQILLMCYDSSALKMNTIGNMTGYILGEMLVEKLVDFAKIGQQRNYLLYLFATIWKVSS